MGIARALTYIYHLMADAEDGWDGLNSPQVNEQVSQRHTERLRETETAEPVERGSVNIDWLNE